MDYESRIKSKQADGLFEAVLELKNLEECYKFFEDVFTVREIEAVAQRFEVAKLLNAKKTYNEIEKETGASTATISRVSRSLNQGAGGYEIVFERLKDISK